MNAVPQAETPQLTPHRQTIQCFQQGKLDLAEDLCRQLLAENSHDAESLHLLGMIAFQRGNSEDAVTFMRRSIALCRNNSYYHSNLGGALQSQGKLQEAIVRYKRAVALKPDLAEAHYNLGNLLRDLGRIDESILAFERALAIRPAFLEALNNQGNVFREQGRLDEALTCCQKAIALKPACAEAHSNLGNIWRDQGRLADALRQYEQAITYLPTLVQAHYNRANVLQNQGHLDAAAVGYERVLTLAPAMAEAHYNLGCTHFDRGNPQQAILRHKKALEAKPDFAKARLALALAELIQGNYAQGWAGYESRWQSDDHTTAPRPYKQPLWAGASLQGESVLIWGEQGIGDEILFAGLIPDVLRTGVPCILECNHRLKPLFARSFPQAEVICAADSPPVFAAQIPSGSLPGLLRQNASSFRHTQSPYLLADPFLQQNFRDRYQDGRFILGLAWHSNNPKTGQARSINLSAFQPLTSTRNIQWISLQYGDNAALQRSADHARVPLFVDASVNQLLDMDSFAAQVSAMDLVITIDNSTAHLAGALGVPVWLLLPYASDWRWLQRREDCPWYPSMRLFRQTQPGDWQAPLNEVALRLQALMVNRNS